MLKLIKIIQGILSSFLIIMVFADNAKAFCDIRPIARSYFNEIVAYSTFGLLAPRLIISSVPLVKIEQEKIKEYGNYTGKIKGVVASSYDSETNAITLFSRVFEDHPKCNAFVYNKTKRYLVHEYTHYLDFNYPLSEMVHADNLETTAIMGENILPKLIWGRRNPMVIRPLTKKEKRNAQNLKRFLISERSARR